MANGGDAAGLKCLHDLCLVRASQAPGAPYPPRQYATLCGDPAELGAGADGVLLPGAGQSVWLCGQRGSLYAAAAQGDPGGDLDHRLYALHDHLLPGDAAAVESPRRLCLPRPSSLLRLPVVIGPDR